jgi:hypothetical protein
MSGMGDIQPVSNLSFVPQPAIWGEVTAGDDLVLLTIPDYQIARIDYCAITIQYRWEDTMTECELQYGGGSSWGVILAVGAFSSPAFTEFIYQQRYYVASEQPMYIAHGDAAYGFKLASASVNPLGGISKCQAFIAWSMAAGPYGTL